MPTLTQFLKERVIVYIIVGIYRWLENISEYLASGCFYRLMFIKNAVFRKTELFPSSGERIGWHLLIWVSYKGLLFFSYCKTDISWQLLYVHLGSDVSEHDKRKHNIKSANIVTLYFKMFIWTRLWLRRQQDATIYSCK